MIQISPSHNGQVARQDNPPQGQRNGCIAAAQMTTQVTAGINVLLRHIHTHRDQLARSPAVQHTQSVSILSHIFYRLVRLLAEGAQLPAVILTRSNPAYPETYKQYQRTR